MKTFFRPPASAGACTEHFNKIENHGQTLKNCPVCGAKAEMWERIGTVATKAACCNRGDPLGPLTDGCPLYMPPETYYRATYKEAANIWNEAADAFGTARLAAYVQASSAAARHILARIRQDPRLAYLIGPGSESFALLTAEVALVDGTTSDAAYQKYSDKLKFEPWLSEYDIQCRIDEAVATARVGTTC